MHSEYKMFRHIEISIIIVNYNTFAYVNNCIKSIHETIEKPSYEIIVVDNNTLSNEEEEYLQHQKYTIVKRLNKNRGFAAGNNAGIRISKGRTLLLLNPDTLVKPGTIKALYDRLTSDENIAVVGPKIEYPDGRLQTTIIPKLIPGIRSYFNEIFYLDKLFAGNKRFNTCYMSDFNTEKMNELDQVSGACLMIKKDVIKQVGGLDENYFLFYEETDLCLRCKQAGYKILYEPNATIVHHEGGSRTSVITLNTFFESQLYFYKKFYGRPAAAAMFAITIAGLAFRCLLSPMYLIKDRSFGVPLNNIRSLGIQFKPNYLMNVFRP